MDIADVDAGKKEGLTSDERRELVELCRKLRVAEMEVEILVPAAVYFAKENVLPKMAYTFIARRCADLPVATCCRVMGVSTSGFYAWQADPVSERDWATRVLTNTIVDIHTMSRRSYGSPRVHAELRWARGSAVAVSGSRGSCASIAGIYRRKGRGCTRRDPDATPSEDLVKRRFVAVDGPDRLWVMDVTERPTDEGKLYLAAVLDASAAGWWAGQSPITSAPSSWSTPCRWRIWRRQPPAGRDGGPFGPRIAIHVLGLRSHGSGRPGCSARWAPSGTASTTAPWRASSGPCRSSCSTSTAGRHASNWPSPCSTGSRPGTTRKRRHSYCQMLSPVDYEAHLIPAASAAWLSNQPVRRSGGSSLLVLADVRPGIGSPRQA